MTSYYLVDSLIIGWLILTGYEGYKKGMPRSLLELIGFLASILAGLFFYPLPAYLLRKNLGISLGISNLVSFTLIFIFALLLYFVVFSPIFYWTQNHRPKWRTLYHSGGMLFEFIKGIIVVAMVTTILTFFPIKKEIRSSVNRSYLGSKLANSTGAFEPKLEQIFGRAIEEGMFFSIAFVKSRTASDVKPGRPPDKLLKFAPEEEKEMLDLINAERTKKGLPRLVFDEKLRQAARKHSLEMFKKNYFSHTSPVNGNLASRLYKNRIDYYVAGENLALAPDVQVAHEGLMDSPGHRENILTSQYRKVGIGIVDAGIYEQMFTQEFTD